jgi:1-acyl-sn-glycerol-3-phosphate acyltransferase
MFYDVISSLLRPLGWWARLRVEGLEHLPAEGPTLLAPNHDSQMDPVLIGLAAKPRRNLRYLAGDDLWKIPLLGPILDGMRQIPVKRGSGDSRALDRTVEALKAGDVVTVFPEGRLSWGQRLRARSGLGLLAGWVPEAVVVLCTIEGSTGFVRFPTRPRVTVRFFRPASGGIRPGEDPAVFSARMLKELRDRVPATPAGRKRIIGGPPRVQPSLARNRALNVLPPEPPAAPKPPAPGAGAEAAK